MVETRSPSRRFWRRRDSLDVCLRLARGQTRGTIAAAMGWSPWTIRARIRRERLAAPGGVEAHIQMAAEFEILKLVDALQDADPGSAAQSRLLLNLRALSRQFARPMSETESDMKSLKQIRDMSDEELEAYVDSLVPGLETKTGDRLDEIGTGIPGHLSLPAHGAAFPETAARDELAKLALPGWPRCGKDTGRG